jgi:aspartate aminotransferase-like enzyme
MLPGPTNVSDRVMQAMLSPVINHRSHDFAELHKNVIEGCRYVFDTKKADVVVLSSSGTGGVDAAMQSILDPGDSVVIPAFGEFSSRLGDSARYLGAKVIAPEANLGGLPNLESVEASMKQAPKVKALCVVYNETSTGVTWRKLKELKELANKYGSLFIVDAISVLGGDFLPVDELGVDVCITGSQKCLAAPPGLAILCFSEEARKIVMKAKDPKSQYFDIKRYFKYAESGETPYTPALPLFYALDEALKIVKEEGLERRIRRHAVCAKAFYDAFESIGISAHCKNLEERSHTVIGMVYPKGIEDQKFRSILSERFWILIAGGFGALRGKMFRLGCMGEVNQQIVTATVSGIANCLKLLGYDCDPSRALERVWSALGEPTFDLKS